MLQKALYIILAVDLLFSSQTCAKRPFRLEVQNVSCTTVSTAMVKHCSANVMKLAESRYGVNMFFEFQKNLTPSAEIEFLIDVLSHGVNLKFVNLKLNLCDALGNARTMPLIKEIINRIMQSSDMQMQCPIKGNYAYNLTNVIVDADLLPIYVPTVLFNFTFNIYDKRQHTFSFKLLGSTTKLS